MSEGPDRHIRKKRGYTMDDLHNPKEPLIQKLRQVIRFAVRLLAVLMTLLIIWGG